MDYFNQIRELNAEIKRVAKELIETLGNKYYKTPMNEDGEIEYYYSMEKLRYGQYLSVIEVTDNSIMETGLALDEVKELLPSTKEEFIAAANVTVKNFGFFLTDETKVDIP